MDELEKRAENIVDRVSRLFDIIKNEIILFLADLNASDLSPEEKTRIAYLMLSKMEAARSMLLQE